MRFLIIALSLVPVYLGHASSRDSLLQVSQSCVSGDSERELECNFQQFDSSMGQLVAVEVHANMADGSMRFSVENWYSYGIREYSCDHAINQRIFSGDVFDNLLHNEFMNYTTTGGPLTGYDGSTDFQGSSGDQFTYPTEMGTRGMLTSVQERSQFQGNGLIHLGVRMWGHGMDCTNTADGSEALLHAFGRATGQITLGVIYHYLSN